MPIINNQVVIFTYTLTDDGGNVVDQATKEQPFSFISGNNQILPKLEESLGEMLIGSKKTIALEAKDAYGEYKDEAVQVVKRSEFPADTQIEEGMSFVADTPDGRQLPFTVKQIEGDDITLDFNHPLAGRNLTFDVELVDKRDATQEELSHGHAHGPDGHHH